MSDARPAIDWLKARGLVEGAPDAGVVARETRRPVAPIVQERTMIRRSTVSTTISPPYGRMSWVGVAEVDAEDHHPIRVGRAAGARVMAGSQRTGDGSPLGG
ncbi:hypothetical protein [Micromonospora sp. WMMD987]|uniref:hypothetical protein n=1 Tax=Micromonospora sp. WMMD987 TaxID=3016089 RepID=UPI00249A0350|nr:hypothetical protein [Micromonospora sp. WMMD987]WFE96367.1 hypothetical protein O7612_05525 [Micromonospora sp. WMMD987]